MTDWSHIHCSFFGQSQQDVDHIVTTPDQCAAICGDCVRICAEAIEKMPSKPARANWPYGSMGEYLEDTK